MKVVIIGAGNVATVLGRLMLAAGHEIVQVASRQREHAARLAELLNSGHTVDLAELSPDGELYLVAISDTALVEFGGRVRLPGKLVVHTAGSVPMEVLAPVSDHIGVLYPLQSLRKEIWPSPEIPLLVDGGTGADLERVMVFARTLPARVEAAGDGTRMKLHLAGVFLNNFSNHLYALAEEYCRKEAIDFGLLQPLIKETAARISYFHPRDVQTGPAIRGDEVTVKKHLELLDNYDDIKALYGLFTKQIEEIRRERKG